MGIPSGIRFFKYQFLLYKKGLPDLQDKQLHTFKSAFVTQLGAVSCIGEDNVRVHPVRGSATRIQVARERATFADFLYFYYLKYLATCKNLHTRNHATKLKSVELIYIVKLHI
jgi:hypothetical protein